MRVLIVDGHSMIFAWPEMRKLHQKRNALARGALIKSLTEYQDSSGVRVVAVFDGQGAKVSETTEPGGVQVFYSGAGHTADNVIERLVARYAKEHDITVATDDHLEEQTAMSFGATCISADGLKALLADAKESFQRELKKHNRASP
jgi:uncharacterized protein